MTERLPPLTALRAFEAAARHMSFAAAATELNVTPAALSFQIKNLEEHLGRPLFRRLNRAVELTPEGRALAPGTTEGFERLTAAWRATRRLQDSQKLTVTAGPAFTAKWLSPRFYDFAQSHPEIELRFAASLKVMDFARDEVDVAIRYGTGCDEDLCALDLFEDWHAPFMTPALALRFPDAASLTKAPLFFDDSIDWLDSPVSWTTWFRACGIDFNASPQARFSQADHAIDAAAGGGGVVFTRASLAMPAVASGLLVAPFDIALASQSRFRVLCAKGSEHRPQIAAFRDWVVREIDKISSCVPKKRIVDPSV